MNRFRRGFCALLLFALAGYICADNAEDRRTISTSGDAVIYVVPDEAILTFGFLTLNQDLEAAKAENDEGSKKITDAVKAFGIEPKHFATDNVAVSLRYDTYGRNSTRGTTITAYEVSRTYMITLKDMDKLQPMIDAILGNGANIFEGVEFRTTELRKHRDRAREMAILAAKEKAEGLADVLNCKVGAPRTINESGGFWGMYNNRRGLTNAYQNVAQEAPAESPVESDTLPLGQIAIKATVNATFDLLPEAVESPTTQIAQ